MFTITPAALMKLKQLKPNDSEVLLVSISGGGCSGLMYQMKWQEHWVIYDKQIYVNPEHRIIVGTDKKSALFLEDIELDYEDGLNGKGFVWNNPKATRVCGCGSSFST